MSPPDAVRVWRGFRSPALTLPNFFERLGTVFIPATVEMQWQVGLRAYLPSVTAGLPGKPDSVPDETALLWWSARQAYTDGFETLAVRTYTLTHGQVYTPTSRADFPGPFTGTLDAENPSFLAPDEIDWMHGHVHHLVGARPPASDPATFRQQAADAIAAHSPPPVEGAVVCLGDDYLAYWECTGAPGPPSALLRALQQLTAWSQILSPAPTRLGGGLWDRWPGLSGVGPGSSFNLQFDRN